MKRAPSAGRYGMALHLLGDNRPKKTEEGKYASKQQQRAVLP